MIRRRCPFGESGAVFFALLLAACSGPSSEMRKAVNARIAASDYAGAEKIISDAKLASYGRKNQVLYYLDIGAVEHDAGQYKESDASLDRAERRMEELYTKSLHQGAGTLLLNDNTMDYAGERFERALVNVYRALDYLFLGNTEEALVEVRKLSRLLQEYADVYGGGSTAYKDDAFAQYLSSLLYADGKQPDDARIAMDKARTVYGFYAKFYGTPSPSFPEAPPDQGEIVFLHANGPAPRKVSKSFSVAWNQALFALNASHDDEASVARARNAVAAGFLGRSITVSYPTYVQDPYRITSSGIEVNGQQVPTQLMEDVTAIAAKDLAERQALIKTRAIARAAIKFILSKAATDEAKKKYGENSWQARLTQAATALTSAATEFADTRAWATLPAQFRLARLSLPPGTYDVTALYKDAAGGTVSSHIFKGVLVRKGLRTYLHDRTAL